MKQPRILRGGNPDIGKVWHKDINSDPSGFSQINWTSSDVDHLCKMTQQIVQELCGEAPAAVADRFPEEISLYAGHYGQGQLASILMSWSPQEAIFAKQRIKEKPVQKLEAISVGHSPEILYNDPATIIASMRHELLHVLVNNSFPSRPLQEAVVEKLNRRYSRQSAIEKKHLQWDSSRIVGTSGIGAEEFADVVYSRGTSEVMKVAAVTTFQRQTEEQLWNVCAALPPVTLQGKTYTAHRASIEKAMKEVFGISEADQVLRSIVMRQFTSGIHHFLIPAGTNILFAYTLRAEQNPNYLKKTPHWDCQFFIEDVAPQIQVEVHASQQNPMTGTLTYQCGQPIRFQDIAQMAQQRSQGRIQTSDIGRIVCKLGSIECVLTA